jgi:hypothetical protein
MTDLVTLLRLKTDLGSSSSVPRSLITESG